MAIEVLTHKVVQLLNTELMQHGFSKNGELQWIRVRNEFIDCMDMQIRSDRTAFCVNLGEHLAYLPIAGGDQPFNRDEASTAQCEIKTRLAPDGLSDYWWSLSNETELELLARSVEAVGIEFFRTYQDFRNPFINIAMESIDSVETLELMPTMTKVRRILMIARTYDYIDDAVGAIAWSKFGLENCGKAVSVKAAFRDIVRRRS